MKATSETVRADMERRSTEELTSILRNRDPDEWRPEVFDVVADVLRQRGVSPEDVAAMGPEGWDVVEAEPMTTLQTFFGTAEAHLARAALEEAGVPAWVTEEVMGSMYGVGVGARVRVRASDAARAAEILASGPASAADLPPEMAEPPCPACGSRNVAPEAWVSGADGDARGSDDWRDWHYVCADCGEAWRAEPAPGSPGP